MTPREDLPVGIEISVGVIEVVVLSSFDQLEGYAEAYPEIDPDELERGILIPRLLEMTTSAFDRIEHARGGFTANYIPSTGSVFHEICDSYSRDVEAIRDALSSSKPVDKAYDEVSRRLVALRRLLKTRFSKKEWTYIYYDFSAELPEEVAGDFDQSFFREDISPFFEEVIRDLKRLKLFDQKAFDEIRGDSTGIPQFLYSALTRRAEASSANVVISSFDGGAREMAEADFTVVIDLLYEAKVMMDWYSDLDKFFSRLVSVKGFRKAALRAAALAQAENEPETPVVSPDSVPVIKPRASQQPENQPKTPQIDDSELLNGREVFVYIGGTDCKYIGDIFAVFRSEGCEVKKIESPSEAVGGILIDLTKGIDRNQVDPSVVIVPAYRRKAKRILDVAKDQMRDVMMRQLDYADKPY